MACGLGMLFHIPLTLGVCITALDVMLILRLQRRGVRYLEMFIIGLVGMIGACLAAQMWLVTSSDRRDGAGFRADDADSEPPRDALPCGRHRGRNGNASQPLPAFVDRKNPSARYVAKGYRRAIRYATLDSNLRFRIGPICQRGNPGAGRRGISSSGQLPRLGTPGCVSSPFSITGNHRGGHRVWHRADRVGSQFFHHRDACRPNSYGRLSRHPSITRAACVADASVGHCAGRCGGHCLRSCRSREAADFHPRWCSECSCPSRSYRCCGSPRGAGSWGSTLSGSLPLPCCGLLRWR